jgi:ABC-type uncharacterized transport system permease subunit
LAIDLTVFLISTLAGGVQLGTPLVLAALGETYAERSGVMNLGVEGTMLVGAFAGFWGAYASGNLWLGVLVGVTAGALMGLVMAFTTITLRGDQIVSGIAVTLFGIGISIYLYSSMFGANPVRVSGFDAISIPVLSQIPVLGPVLFQNDILVYLALILVPVSAFVLFKTTLGLNIQAVGENPVAADAAGVNVFRIRYLCVILGGALAGLAGAYLSLAYLNVFVENMTAGRGWIAVILVILGRWNPFFVLGGSFLFGSINALELRLQLLNSNISPQLLTMLPYAVAIAALLLVYRRQKAPAALGEPYVRG